ncbi:MAG: hypothetical protein AB7N91_24420 [Candidatus Tectimicrobiota bacterium]
MLQITDTMRVYLNEGRQGVITCLYCGQKRRINMSNYKDHHIGGRALKVKCSVCGRIFHVRFDFRRYHRLSVQLVGKLLRLNTQEEIEAITVTSLSVGGIGFLLENPQEVQCGQRYGVSFHLDDAQHSLICEDILVKRIEGNFIGAEFYQSDKYNYELDFYIMSEPGSI